ncbi:MAG: peptide deformylase [Firmicutes bacterium]|nr:peptide deformylase [Bacillota bacterium]
MALIKIRTSEEPVLRQKSREITKITKKIKVLAQDMLDTMYQANGVGLAAPQVGISERIVVIDVGTGPIVLINPVITKAEGKNRDVEGCLSLPGRNEYVTRAEKVSVVALDLTGKQINLTGEGLLARAFQHEIDHLNGILFIDYLNPAKE